MNSITIDGNLTRDPEQQGNGPVKVGLAHNKRVKDKDSGEWTSVPQYFDVVAWRWGGEDLLKLNKGQGVVVHGRLEYSTWEKDGEKRSKVEIVADTVAAKVPKDVAPSSSDW